MKGYQPQLHLFISNFQSPSNFRPPLPVHITHIVILLPSFAPDKAPGGLTHLSACLMTPHLYAPTTSNNTHIRIDCLIQQTKPFCSLLIQ